MRTLPNTRRLTSMTEAPRVLLGVDDVFAGLFPNHAAGEGHTPTLLAALDRLYAGSHLPIDMYVFWRGHVGNERRTLRQLAAPLAEQLAARPWLRVGPHGLDHATPPYLMDPAAQQQVFTDIYTELERLTTPHQRARNVRLHCFSESFALADWWRTRGVEALLLTDRPAVAYHLDARSRAELAERGETMVNGMRAYRTHERIEDLAQLQLDDRELAARLDAHLQRHGRLVLCSHEADLARPEVVDMALRCLRHARARGCVGS